MNNKKQVTPNIGVTRAQFAKSMSEFKRRVNKLLPTMEEAEQNLHDVAKNLKN